MPKEDAMWVNQEILGVMKFYRTETQNVLSAFIKRCFGRSCRECRSSTTG